MARNVIKCDGLILHDSYDDKYNVTAPSCELPVNESGTLKFQLPPTHIHYNDLKKVKSEITFERDGDIIFKGRTMKDDKPFDNIKNVECEGALAYLIDSIQPTYDFKGSVKNYLELLITRHNSQVEENKRFKIGKVTVKDPDGNDVLVRASSQYPTTFDEIKNKLLDMLDGYMFIDYNTMTIDYIAYDDLPKSNQKIEFSKNILDLSQLLDGTEIATRIIPRGCEIENKDAAGDDIVDQEGNKVIKRLDIKSVNGGKEYVESELGIESYGTITKVVEFDDVTEPENLLRKGKEVLNEQLFSTTSIELTAVDLSLINADMDRIKTGDIIEIISKPHDIEAELPVSKVTYDLENPANDTCTLGIQQKKLTDIIDEKVVVDLREQAITSSNTNLLTWHDGNYDVGSVRFTKIGQIVSATINLCPNVAEIESGAVARHIATLGTKIKPESAFNFTIGGGLFTGTARCSRNSELSLNGQMSWHTDETLFSGVYDDVDISRDFARFSIVKFGLTGSLSGGSIEVEFSGTEGSVVQTITGTTYIRLDRACQRLTTRKTGSGTPNMTIAVMSNTIQLSANYVTSDTSGVF